MTTRRRFCLAMAGAGLAGPLRAAAPPVELGMALREDQLAAGRAFLKAHPAVDVHSHAGRFFIDGSPATTKLAASQQPAFLERSVAAMRTGGLSAVLLDAVSDHIILESGGGLKAYRDYAPGEAFADYRRQVALLKKTVATGLLARGRSGRDIRTALAKGETSVVFAVEGGDFIEDRLDRVGLAQGDGVRAITIIHYNVNQIGDPQTSSPVHGGLSPIGRAVVREMNHRGVLVDLSHASLEATRQAAQVSTRPMMISHSNLKRPGVEHPRLITEEHARLVTAASGVIGILPAGATMERFSDFIDGIFRAADALGIDHVAVGSDMDFTFQSVLGDYADWGLLPAGLLARGMHAPEVAKVVGGNFIRVLDAVQR